MSFVFAHFLENLTVCSLISLLNSTNNLAMLNIIGMATNKLLQNSPANLPPMTPVPC